MSVRPKTTMKNGDMSKQNYKDPTDHVMVFLVCLLALFFMWCLEEAGNCRMRVHFDPNPVNAITCESAE
jgi:hypothetical protein